jgi:hypothetical protein
VGYRRTSSARGLGSRKAFGLRVPLVVPSLANVRGQSARERQHFVDRGPRRASRGRRSVAGAEACRLGGGRATNAAYANGERKLVTEHSLPAPLSYWSLQLDQVPDRVGTHMRLGRIHTLSKRSDIFK